MTHWHRPMRREPPLVPLPKKVPPIGPELPPPIDPTTPIPTDLPMAPSDESIEAPLLISSAAFDVRAVSRPHASRERQDGVAADLVFIR